jgi:hypothetical protein
MKLFNNISEPSEADRPIDRREQRRRSSTVRYENPPTADHLRFDVMDDEFEDAESFGDSQDSEADFENVDVQAILFYGHTGRRCFPSIKAL